MNRKIALLLAALLILLCGCTGGNQVYQVTYLDVFDTVTVISGTAESQAAFQTQAKNIHDRLQEYHRLFDIYKEYEGITNLKTVNDNAGVEPVTVDQAIIDLLLDCKQYYELTGGAVNVCMGTILSLWHEARNAGLEDPENAKLPDAATLEEASNHISWETVLIDQEQNTVYITDPAQSLDVGAVAKGWAAQRVAEELPGGILINLGGNVCATGPKAENTPWVIGVNDPEGDGYLCTLELSLGSAVTSGDYQRFYTVDGVNYHHIIDPQTRMPADRWSSVTILCDDSGLADALSTALFLMDRESGEVLLKQCGAEAMWVDPEGNCYYSAGFQNVIREN